MNIEPLESRIAPAITFIGTHTATYTDVDGDHVTIKVSAGDIHVAVFDFLPVAGAPGEQLEAISLGAAFAHANLTFSVVKAPGGDGLANVGAISCPDNDLGIVTVAGDLGEIDVGDGNADRPAIRALNVRSMGVYGLATHGIVVGDLKSDIAGALGALHVRGDVVGEYINVTGGADGKIGSIFIGGSLVGAGGTGSGFIVATGNISKVVIGGDIVGGTGSVSGQLNSNATLGNVTVKGSLLGGSGDYSGQIFGHDGLGVIKIGGDVRADQGRDTGKIKTIGTIAGVVIGGSLIGGGAEDFDPSSIGQIHSTGDMGSVKIGGDVRGGAGNYSGSIQSSSQLISLTIGGSVVGSSAVHSARIFSASNMGAVTIGHDVRAGAGDGSAAIDCGGTIERMRIGGSLVGGAGSYEFTDPDNTQHFGQISAVKTINAVTIGGDVVGSTGSYSGAIISVGLLRATIGGSLIGGDGSASGSIRAHNIGTVKIGRDVIGAGPNSGLIHANDATSITIGGSLIGGTANESGGIKCQGSLGSLTIRGDLRGASISSGSLVASGFVLAGGHIGSVFIGGSVIAGENDSSSNALGVDGAIATDEDIGSLTVKGSLIGSVGSGGVNDVAISAVGQSMPTATTDLAIGSIVIGGRVERARITTPTNGNAQIGSVKVGGDWIASDLIVGVQDGGTAGFGDPGDTIIGGGASIAKIASITIGGQVAGTPGSTDHFGFVSHKIGAFKMAGFTATLHAVSPPLDVVELSPITGDVTLREV